MVTQSNLEDELIHEEIKKQKGNLSKVARALGLDFYDLKRRTFADRPLTRPMMFTGGEPADIRTLGKPGFEQFVIAIKRPGGSWPDKYDNVLVSARQKFDAGTHEMFQTTGTEWVVQYLIPYRVPVGPRSFFSSMGSIR